MAATIGTVALIVSLAAQVIAVTAAADRNARCAVSAHLVGWVGCGVGVLALWW